MHNLTGADISRYLVSRLNSSHYPFRADFTKDGEGVEIALTARKDRRAITLRPEITTERKKEILELVIDADIPQTSHKDVENFLEGLLDNDSIFQKGGALYSPERQEDLPRLKRILKRLPYQESQKKSNPVIACEVVDSTVNKNTLESALWEYMVRPALVLLYRI